jgi:hypothetical protein
VPSTPEQPKKYLADLNSKPVSDEKLEPLEHSVNSKPPFGHASPKKGTHADLKSTETEQAEPDGTRGLPAPIEIPDSKDATTVSTPPPFELSIKPAEHSSHGHHRRNSSLTTISELAVKPANLTPVSASRSLSNSSVGTTRPKNCEHALCVEDPFRPTENVAMNTSRAALRRIQESLEVARTTLLAHAPLGQIFVASVEEKLPQIEEV